MKATIIILVIAVIVFACHRKTVASSDNIVISNKTNNETKAVNPEVASAGQKVNANRCGRCHGLK
jgi:cytochrome c5